MIIHFTTLIHSHLSYFNFIWHNRFQRQQLLLGVALSTLLFTIFKLLYTYPDFFSDSYSYIFAAQSNLNVSIWPIGYSKFLSIVHYFTHSDLALVAIQYFLIQFASLHLYFTALYFFPYGKWARQLALLFISLSPLTLYLSNTVNSDALFAAFSIFWITQLIWIIQRPRAHQLFSQAVLLAICFTIRNNAYYYPILGAFAFLLSKQSVWRKSVAIIASFSLIGLFVQFTRNEAYKLAGVRQFSLFTGWQLANNALYIYNKVHPDSNIFPTRNAKELNRMSVQYYRHVKSEAFEENLRGYVGNFFIRQPEAPLKQYFFRHYNPGSQLSAIVCWARASDDFSSFGKPIILHYPAAYLQYFVYPNAWRYFIPPLSHLERYNYGRPAIEPVAQHWFDYPQPQVHTFSYGLQGTLLVAYQGLFLAINIFYIGQLLLLLTRRRQLARDTLAPHYIVALFFVLNLVFSLVATVNILRYQFVPMIVLFLFSMALNDMPFVTIYPQKIPAHAGSRFRNTFRQSAVCAEEKAD